MHSVDEFIIYDDVQYTRSDWRNRNRIKTPHGTHWLTIPVEFKWSARTQIQDVRVADPGWGERHWKTLHHVYAKAPFFNHYAKELEALYRDDSEPFLSRINYRFIAAINRFLGIQTPLIWSTVFKTSGNETERLVSICRQVGAQRYLSGPAARAYLDEGAFRAAGMEVVWMDYSGYPEYPQMHPPFDHHVTVLDLLFSTGPEAPHFMKSFRGKV